MDVEKFIAEATNPEAWRTRALSLRESADAVWGLFGEKFTHAEFSEAYPICLTSQFLYGLSAECLLKGLIIKQSPESITISTTMNGQGDITSAEIKKMGENSRDMHNLEKLAESAGLFKDKNNPTIRELLAYVSHCIRWRGRYPTPLSAESDFTPRGQLHYKEFGHYFRDIMDPFLDSLIEMY